MLSDGQPRESHSMLPALALAKPDMQGIPITAPISDPAEARQTLANLSVAYPGELFTIETQSAAFDPPMYVTWIPVFSIQHILTQTMTPNLSYPQLPDWPTKP
jgi:hypothetical protein